MINKKVDDIVISNDELRYVLPILYKMRKQFKCKYDIELKLEELVREFRKYGNRGLIK